MHVHSRQRLLRVPFNLHTVYINTKLKERNWCGFVCLSSSAPALACPRLSWLDHPSRPRSLLCTCWCIRGVPGYLGLPSRWWRWWCLRGPGPRSALACTGRGPGSWPCAGCSRPAAAGPGQASWLQAAGVRSGRGSQRRLPGAQGQRSGCGAAGFIGSRGRIPAEACGTELRHMSMACTCGFSVT